VMPIKQANRSRVEILIEKFLIICALCFSFLVSTHSKQIFG
jgi:hypothetical protein